MPPTYSATSGFSLPSAPATSLSTSTCTEAWTEKSFRLFPLPAPPEPLLEPGPGLFDDAGQEAHGQPAVGDLGGELDRRFVSGREVDRDVRVHVQDGFQRLAVAHDARSVVGRGDLAAVVRDRRLA